MKLTEKEKDTLRYAFELLIVDEGDSISHMDLMRKLGLCGD